MFRAMRREKQALTREECLDVLRRELRGVLSVLGDEGYPYGIPMNHFYCEEDGRLYFHSGKAGHKIDALKRCPKASFCVFGQGQRAGGSWALDFKSVVVFGRVEFVEDREQIYEIARRLSAKFTDDKSYVENEVVRSGPATAMFALIPEHITGKKVNES